VLAPSAPVVPPLLPVLELVALDEPPDEPLDAPPDEPLLDPVGEPVAEPPVTEDPALVTTPADEPGPAEEALPLGLRQPASRPSTTAT